MRLMHVMAGAKEGGAENIMLESVLALAEAGLTQHVVTRPDNPFRVQKFREAGIGVDVAAFNNTWPFPTRRVIGDAIKVFKPDVIEYWMGRAGQYAPKEYRNRSIGWYGGYHKLARFVNCEWHVGLTIDLLRHIREQGVPDDRSAIIHTYADFEGTDPASRAALDTPEDAPVALALARLHEKKGLDTLLDATAKVPGLYVWIAGDGPIEAELKAQCTKLGLDDRVRFLGWRNDRGGGWYSFAGHDIAVDDKGTDCDGHRRTRIDTGRNYCRVVRRQFRKCGHVFSRHRRARYVRCGVTVYFPGLSSEWFVRKNNHPGLSVMSEYNSGD